MKFEQSLIFGFVNGYDPGYYSKGARGVSGVV